ncbi:MAG: tetratricopeptide repeat protein [Acidobacteriota bacterium]
MRLFGPGLWLRSCLLVVLAGLAAAPAAHSQPSRDSLEAEARSAYQRDDLDEAIRLYLRILALDLDADERSGTLVRIAWLEHLSGRAERSRDALRDALTDNPDFPFRGSLYSDDFVASYREITGSLQSDRANRDARWVTRAANALREGDVDGARELLDRVLEGSPNDVRALYNRALVASRQGQRSDALGYFERIVALASRGDVPALLHSLALTGVGTEYLRQGNSTDAVSALKDALRIDPGNAQATLALARAYEAQSSWQAAYDVYDRASSAETPYLREKADVLLRMGRNAEAMSLLVDAAAQDPSAPTLSLLGWAQEASGDFAAAVRTYERLVADDPAGPDQLLSTSAARAAERLSALALDQGRFGDAESWATQATRTDGPTASSYTLLGLALLNRSETGRAIAAFKNALTIEPDDAVALNNLGNAYFAEGRVDEAIRAFESAVASDPSMVTAQENLTAARSAPKVPQAAPQRAEAPAAEPTTLRLEDARAPSLQRPAARVIALGDAARAAGLRQGDLLLRIAGQPVLDARDAQRKLDRLSGEVRLDLLRSGEPLSITIVR